MGNIGVCVILAKESFTDMVTFENQRVMDFSILGMWSMNIPGRGNPGTDKAGDLPYVLEEQYSEPNFLCL